MASDISGLRMDIGSHSELKRCKKLASKLIPNYFSVFWFVVIVVTITLLSIQISYTYSKWQDNPMIMSFENFERGVWEVPFPAITICPENKVKAEFSEKISSPLLRENSDYASVFSDICTGFWYENRNRIEFCDLFSIYPANFAKTLKEMSFPYQEKIKKVNFKKRQAHVTQILTDVGLCWSFNLLNESQIFRTGIVDEKFLNEITERGEFDHLPYSWSTENGYSNDEFTLKEYPVRLTTSRTDLGFNFDMILNETSEFLKCNDLRGVKVAIHFPGEWPRLKHQYLSFSMEEKGVVLVKPQLITIAESLKDYAPHK